MSLLPTAVSGSQPSRLTPPPAGRRGFALLITITLLAFLVLLLVSLASLTRVETQVASNNQQLAAARQNALMALNIALGQLQKTVGPDQRTTVRADLADPDNVNGFTTLPKPGATRWTSAWGNANAGDYSQTPSQIESQVDAVTGSVNKPRILSWLVSGNEADPVTANSSGAITSAANTPKFNPGLTITGLTASTTALTPLTLPVSNPVTGATTTSAILLVGPGSVTTANASYSVTTTTGTNYTASDYVVAPLIDIQAPAGTVPGFSTAATIGRYAYWVGDENIKARANLVDNYLQQTTAANQRKAAPYSSLIAQHSGISFMDRTQGTSDFRTYPLPVIGQDFNYNNYNFNTATYNAQGVNPNAPSPFVSPLPQITSFTQLPFLAQSNPINTSNTAISASSTLLKSAAQNRFHDISASSLSVLADSYAGGLKKDLSAALAPNWSPSGETSDSNPLFVPQSSSDYGIPTWGQLRSYANLRTTGTASPLIRHQMPSATNSGVSLLLHYASFGYKFYSDNTGSIYVAIYPLIGLYNAYTNGMEAPTGSAATANAKIGFGIRQLGALTFTLQRIEPDNSVVTLGTIDAKNLVPGGNPYFIFPLRAGSHGAGSGPAIVLAANAADYASNTNTLQQGSTGFNFARINLTAGHGFPSLSAAQKTNQHQYLVTVGGTGGDMDIIYAGRDATLTSYTPPTPSSGTDWNGWFHAIQHVRFAAPTSSGSTVITLNGDPAILPTFSRAPIAVPTGSGATLVPADTPDTVLRIQSVIGGPRGRATNRNFDLGMDPQYELRFWAQSNIRAPLSTPTIKDYYTAGNGFQHNGNGSFAGICVPNTSFTSGATPGAQGRFTAYIHYEGYSSSTGTIGNSSGFGTYHRAGGFTRTFDTPRDDLPLLSIGQLQNANLSLIDAYPAWPLGNSLADFRIPGDRTFLPNLIENPGASTTDRISASPSSAYYDVSWHLNRALWDKFFVSSAPTGPARAISSPSSPPPVAPWAWNQNHINDGIPLPNARMRYYLGTGGTPPTLTHIANVSGSGNLAYERAAANLMLAGGFNINSTSAQAWRALYGGTAHTPYRYYSVGTGAYGTYNPDTNDRWSQSRDDTTPYLNSPVNRLVSPTDNIAALNSGFGYNSPRNLSASTSGTDSLSDPNWKNSIDALPYIIAKLATDTVTQVKRRGPFLSLGDFVNRRLLDTTSASPSVDPDSTSATSSVVRANTALKGTLQAALDTGTIDATVTAQISSGTSAYPVSVNPRSKVVISDSGNDNQLITSTTAQTAVTTAYGPQYVNHMRGSTYDTTSGQHSYQSRQASGSLGTVTQADLLATFGAGLVARSDTFTIRTYGETVNPVTSLPEGRAWCEAVVQRVPDYVDSSDDAYKHPSAANATNRAFGRKFLIVSFRWLTSSDI